MSTRKCQRGKPYRKSKTRKVSSGRALNPCPAAVRTTRKRTSRSLRNGPGIGPLRKGELTKYGYKNVAELSVADRHKALEKAIDEYGSLGVWRKLNAVAVYTKRTLPKLSKIFKEDMNWIRAKFGIKAF